MASTESHSSRFNPFKFNSKPPPLPPKDPIYQRTSPAPLLAPAVTAIVNDTTSFSTPTTPISPSIQYAIRRANSPSPSPFSESENNHIVEANMNHSSSSLLSPPISSQDNYTSNSISTSTRHTTAMSSKKGKPLAFLKFPKRSPRSPPPQPSPSLLGSGGSNEDGDDVPLPPQEDDNISMPWNFQVCVTLPISLP